MVAVVGAAVSGSPTAAAQPAGPPVGQAVMKVVGTSNGPVTIHYQINGGPEQTETDVTLPWQKSYPVFAELESKVGADAAGTSLVCTITMDGDKLVSFQSRPQPVCNFAYWG